MIKITTIRYRSKILPFRNDIPLPQRLKFSHKGRTYEVEYRRNSFDSDIYMKIRDMLGYDILYSGRLTESSVHTVRNKDTQLPIFILIVKDISIDNIKILLIDEDFRFLE